VGDKSRLTSLRLADHPSGWASGRSLCGQSRRRWAQRVWRAERLWGAVSPMLRMGHRWTVTL